MVVVSSAKDSSSPFGKKLAANDKQTRDKAVKALGKWISKKTDFTHLELMKLWKGLFYCMWMSDKPIIQQQLSETLSSLILRVPRQGVMDFIATFWETMCAEWHGIDRLRLDKFYFLLRRFISYSFRMLKENEWDLATVEEYSNVMINGPLNATSTKVPDGIRFHLIEIYLEELEKVVDVAHSGEVPTAHILQPMFHLLGHTINGKVFKMVAEEVFESILKKTAAGEGEDSDFEVEADLTVFDKIESRDDDDEIDEAENDQDEDMADGDDDDEEEEEEEEAKAMAEMEMEMEGEGDADAESTTFDYDLMGIKERLFAVVVDENTIQQNRRKVDVLYKAYQDFCPLEDDDSEAEDEEDAEENNNK